jgi:hypothetical protein
MSSQAKTRMSPKTRAKAIAMIKSRRSTAQIMSVCGIKRNTVVNLREELGRQRVVDGLQRCSGEEWDKTTAEIAELNLISRVWSLWTWGTPTEQICMICKVSQEKVQQIVGDYAGDWPTQSQENEHMTDHTPHAVSRMIRTREMR